MERDDRQATRRVFISCLGTSPYVPVSYEPLNEEEKDAWVTLGQAPVKERYIQTARLKALRARGLEPTHVRILVTGAADSQNWADAHERGSGPGASFGVLDGEGLAGDLRALGLDPMSARAEIPVGADETEVWEIFSRVVETIEEGDEVYVDLTHGFRTISVAMLMALQFAVRARNATLAELSYGAFEAVKNDPAGELPRPTFDLTPFFELNRWVDAVAVFRATGDLRVLAVVFGERVKEVQRLLRRETPNELRRAASALKSLSGALMESRLLEVSGAASRLCEALLGVEYVLSEQSQTRPMALLVAEIRKRVDPLTGVDSEDMVHSDLRDIRAGFAATCWCLEHESWMQGFTFLRESLTSLIQYRLVQLGADRATKDKHPEPSRYHADRIVSGIPREHQALGGAAFDDLDERRDFERLWESIPLECRKQLASTVDKVLNVRNGLSHGHTAQNATPSDKLKQCAERDVPKLLQALETWHGCRLVHADLREKWLPYTDASAGR